MLRVRLQKLAALNGAPFSTCSAIPGSDVRCDARERCNLHGNWQQGWGQTMGMSGDMTCDNADPLLTRFSITEGSE